MWRPIQEGALDGLDGLDEDIVNRAKICDGRKKGQDGLDGGQQEVGDTRPQAPVDQDEGEDQSREDKDE